MLMSSICWSIVLKIVKRYLLFDEVKSHWKKSLFDLFLSVFFFSSSRCKGDTDVNNNSLPSNGSSHSHLDRSIQVRCRIVSILLTFVTRIFFSSSFLFCSQLRLCSYFHKENQWKNTFHLHWKMRIIRWWSSSMFLSFHLHVRIFLIFSFFYPLSILFHWRNHLWSSISFVQLCKLMSRRLNERITCLFDVHIGSHRKRKTKRSWSVTRLSFPIDLTLSAKRKIIDLIGTTAFVEVISLRLTFFSTLQSFAFSLWLGKRQNVRQHHW